MVQLVAPASLAAVSSRVLHASQDLQRLARERGEAYRFHMQLTGVRVWMPEYEDARRAVEALDAWRAAYEAEDSNMMDAHDAASAALDRIPNLSSEGKSALLNDGRLSRC